MSHKHKLSIAVFTTIQWVKSAELAGPIFLTSTLLQRTLRCCLHRVGKFTIKFNMYDTSNKTLSTYKDGHNQIMQTTKCQRFLSFLCSKQFITSFSNFSFNWHFTVIEKNQHCWYCFWQLNISETPFIFAVEEQATFYKHTAGVQAFYLFKILEISHMLQN